MNTKLLSDIEKYWDALVNEGKKLTFKKGQILFYEGHQPYGVFVLEKGKVSYLKKNEHGDEITLSCDEDAKHENICPNYLAAPVSKGHVIGMGPFLRDKPFCCTCQASEDCEVVFISKTQLSELQDIS